VRYDEVKKNYQQIFGNVVLYWISNKSLFVHWKSAIKLKKLI